MKGDGRKSSEELTQERRARRSKRLRQKFRPSSNGPSQPDLNDHQQQHTERKRQHFEMAVEFTRQRGELRLEELFRNRSVEIRSTVSMEGDNDEARRAEARFRYDVYWLLAAILNAELPVKWNRDFDDTGVFSVTFKTNDERS